MVKVDLNYGVYVLAVSGGVDSVALLHILAQLLGGGSVNYKFLIAHFDHGIRDDSRIDRQFVGELAKGYGLPFVHYEGHLGAGASEEAARKARYNFLHHARTAAGARAIVTAHHQDDLIETVFLNLMRGTGRKGLSSLKSTEFIERPLLRVPKSQLVKYARDNQLVWHEDSTNQDDSYMRNRVRHQIVPRMSGVQRKWLLKVITQMHELNKNIDQQLSEHLNLQPAANRLDRDSFLMLPQDVGLELLATWLRQHQLSGFDTKTLQRLSLAAKTYKPGQKTDVNGNYYLLVDDDYITLQGRP